MGNRFFTMENRLLTMENGLFTMENGLFTANFLGNSNVYNLNIEKGVFTIYVSCKDACLPCFILFHCIVLFSLYCILARPEADQATISSPKVSPWLLHQVVQHATTGYCLPVLSPPP